MPPSGAGAAISRSNGRVIATLCALVAAGAGCIIAASLVASPDGLEGWRYAARYTARFSFCLFLVVFLVRPWHELWPSPSTRRLMEHRRALGLAFATAHFVHLYALIRFRVTSGQMPPLGLPLIGGVAAYVLVAAMTATSNDAAVRALGPRAWKRLHTVGMYWIWFNFVEFYGTRIANGRTFFIPFVLGALAVFGLRIAAWVQRARRGNELPVKVVAR